jgi:hypothetical protein
MTSDARLATDVEELEQIRERELGEHALHAAARLLIFFSVGRVGLPPLFEQRSHRFGDVLGRRRGAEHLDVGLRRLGLTAAVTQEEQLHRLGPRVRVEDLAELLAIDEGEIALHHQHLGDLRERGFEGRRAVGDHAARDPALDAGVGDPAAAIAIPVCNEH